MSCLITALTRSVIKKTTRKSKQKTSKSKKIHFALPASKMNFEYLNLKAPRKNVEMQSEKNLNFTKNIQQMEIFLYEIR